MDEHYEEGLQIDSLYENCKTSNGDAYDDDWPSPGDVSGDRRLWIREQREFLRNQNND